MISGLGLGASRHKVRTPRVRRVLVNLIVESRCLPSPPLSLTCLNVRSRTPPVLPCPSLPAKRFFSMACAARTASSSQHPGTRSRATRLEPLNATAIEAARRARPAECFLEEAYEAAPRGRKIRTRV